MEKKKVPSFLIIKKKPKVSDLRRSVRKHLFSIKKKDHLDKNNPEEYPKELKKIEKIIVSVFVVDKSMRKICRSMKDTVVKTLHSQGFKPLRIVKGSGFFMWDILPENDK